jgi:hypothetical protein
MGAGFLLGLAMDVADASLMGQHALAYVLAPTAPPRCRAASCGFRSGSRRCRSCPCCCSSSWCSSASRHARGADLPGLDYFIGPLVAACAVVAADLRPASAAVPAGRAATPTGRSERTPRAQSCGDSAQHFATAISIASASASLCRGAVVLAFGLLIARFVWLQVIQHDYYITRAEDNRISLVPIVPNRGVIVDRNGSSWRATTRPSRSRSRRPRSRP